jgi:hypothetical protein
MEETTETQKEELTYGAKAEAKQRKKNSRWADIGEFLSAIPLMILAFFS